MLLAAALLGALGAAVATAAKAPPVYRPPGRAAARAPMVFVDDTVVVARIEDRFIRVRDFVDRFFNSYMEYRPQGDSLGRAEFLQRLIDKEVIARVARSAKYPETFQERFAMKTETQRALGNALFQHAVYDSIHVTDAEIDSVYDQMKRVLRLGRIRFGSLQTAERMRRDLTEGRISWARAWELRLRIPGDATPTADIGWQERQRAAPAVGRVVFSLPVGGVSTPIAEPPGFTLYRVMDERPAKLQDIRMYRSPLREQIRAEKTFYYRERLLGGLRNAVALHLDSLNVAWAAARFPTKLSGQGSARIVIDASVPSFAPEDTGRVIATYQGGQVTLAHLVGTYREIPELMRPSLDTQEGVRGMVDVMVLEPQLAELARRRGFDKDSSVVVGIERKREEMLVERMYQDSIQARVFIPPAERRRYYKENQHRFVTPPNARYAVFYLEDKAAADSIAARLRRGVRAAAIVRADSLEGVTRGSIQDRRQDDQNAPFFRLVFQDMKVGEITYVGPNETGAYNIVQLISRDEGRPVGFEEADSQIDEFLQQEAADSLLTAFTERHAQRMKIESRPEVLMKIKLVDPQAAN